MARQQRGGFEAWLRGGQTAGHTFDMTVEVIGKLLLLVFAPWTILVAWIVMHNASPAEQIAGGMTAEAWALAQAGPPFTQTISVKSADGSTHPVGVKQVASDPDIAPDAANFWRRFRAGILLWVAGAIMLGYLTAVGFVVFGKNKMKARQIRGQEIEELPALMRQIGSHNQHEARHYGVSHFTPTLLAGVPYPFRTEMEHTLICGAPGSGKSLAIHQLIDSIRAKGQRGIIFDPELDYIRHHYNPKTDIILNPFDKRSPGWSPFFDAKDSPDWAKLGHAIFKDPKSGDPYWVNVARSLFSWTGYQLMEQQRKTRVEVTLTDALDYLFGSPKKLKALLEGTPAAMHLNGLEGARVSSLISVLAEGVEPLMYLHGAPGRFSIRNWVNGKPGVIGGLAGSDGADLAPPPNGFLFLSAPESHMDALRPLLGFWSELAVSALLSRHGIGRETTWFILDEFHSAGRVDALADGPQRLRKYGGAVVLGFQQISQLNDLYGMDKARTIIGQCQTKLILRAGDFETATLMSEQMGRRVMRRVDENTSYGANSIRDGVGLIPKEELEPILLPEDVQNLPKLTGVIRVSNAHPDQPFPIARIKLEYVHRDEVAGGFEPGDTDPVREYLASVQQRASAQAEGDQAGAPIAGGGSKPPEADDRKGGVDEPGPSRRSPTGTDPSAPQGVVHPGDAGGPPEEGLTQARSATRQQPAQPSAIGSTVGRSRPTTPAASAHDRDIAMLRRRLMDPVGPAVPAPATAPAPSQEEPPTTAVDPALALASLRLEPPNPSEAPVDEGGYQMNQEVSSADDDHADQEERTTGRDLEARPEDLSDEEVRRRKRREEEDSLEWARRDALLRGEPVEQVTLVSVYQREIAIERGLAEQEYLGAIEHVTKAEVVYAEHHQHEALAQAGGLLLEAFVGANIATPGHQADIAGRAEDLGEALDRGEETGRPEAEVSAAAEASPGVRREANPDRESDAEPPASAEPDSDIVLAPPLTTAGAGPAPAPLRNRHVHPWLAQDECEAEREIEDPERDFEPTLDR